MQKNFIISVITPVYKSEEFLDETIQSVLDQTIGFEQNIQLILVNDGSPDNSASICQKYQSVYPDNIVYVEKENGGVSSARNMGLKYVQGTYIVFLDSDDFWEKHSFKNIARFFDAHYDEIDACCCRLVYTGDFSKNKHPLDFKYSSGNRIADISEDPDCICTTIGNAVFKSSCLKDVQFDETMKYGEDSWFLNRRVADKMKIGIIADATFYYRKDSAGGNSSIGITRTPSWYFDVPVNYYMKVLSFAADRFGIIPRYFQEVVFYDIKWRGYNPYVLEAFSTEQMQEHLSIMRNVLHHIDDDVILRAKNVNLYKRMYFLNLKYGKNLMTEAVLKKRSFYYDKLRLFTFNARSLLEIHTIDIKDDNIVLTGVSRMSFLERPYQLFAKISTEKNHQFLMELSPLKQGTIRGLIGEYILHPELFKLALPVSDKGKISFYAKVDGSIIRLRPDYNKYSDLDKDYDSSYIQIGPRLLKNEDGRLCIYKNTIVSRLASDYRLTRDIFKNNERDEAREIINERLFISQCDRMPIENRVAFISPRAEDKLLDNMQKVYDRLNLPKVYYSKLKLGSRPDCVSEARRIISTSKVVVTDDYIVLLKNIKNGQHYVQLWHAAGAGKHFGQDGTMMFPPDDALHHRHYDLVTVSSEYARTVFQSAFACPLSVVKATGVARTDDFFDEEYAADIRDRIMQMRPDFKGKQLILYTPTFRDIPGLGRAVFKPILDFDKLSDVLSENQLFLIRPHPVMTAPILQKSYDNILEIRDIATNDLMFVSDMLISDYSSTMFEYSLLRKPMAFYCYDYDSYDRDFYLDFDSELPGPILKTQDELFEYLQMTDHPLADDYDSFYDKFMGACDGHSTDRIVKEIEALFYD